MLSVEDGGLEKEVWLLPVTGSSCVLACTETDLGK